ncbi:hypothetical protein MNBD_GAMMA11-1426 [hydrothermal vent metagenome]|uniref:DUF4136 domain-containing protein n=1 Tax=hydrothermal vent metagenome TaxID=652676 RepID=A0A3B0WPM9_9ZZZZ
MRRYKITVILSGLFWLAGCSTLSVNYDYNQTFNFNQLKTYDWIPFPEDMPASELDRARFVAAIENNLAEKGFTRDTFDPDFLIATHFGKESKVDITNWGYSYAPNTYYIGHGYRYGHYNYGGGYASTGGVNVYEYEQGTLILDFVATESKQLIWRATAKAVVSPASTPQEQTRKVNNGVKEILSEFPPEKTEAKKG